MPDVPPPEELEAEVDVRRRYAEQARAEVRHHFLEPRPVEMRAVEGRHWMNPAPAAPQSHSWFKTVAPLPDDPRVHRAILAYASDMSLLGTCALPHGLSWARGESDSASLDHAVVVP